MHLQTGTYLQGGRYRIEKVLGQGGFGITYSGIQTNLEAKVAIKEFFMKDLCNRDSDTSQVSVGSVGSRETVERFRQKFIKEARNIFRLKHRHIIPVIDVFEENGTAYYVMEHVGGGSLADKVRGGALPESVAVRYIRQVADALDFVHSKRMMHLDVKPANILLSEDDNAVLIDFGLAKQYDNDGQQTSSTPVGISHGYAPIEQYKRGGVSVFSPATDIYSLGATLFKLVTGITPPDASDVGNEGLPLLPSEISPAVRGAIEAAMQFRVKDRPQSIAEFLAMLTENCGERVGESLLAHKASVSSLGEAKTETNERVGESLLAHKTSVSSLGEAKTENNEAINDSKDHSEDTVAPRDLKVSKDSKINDPKGANDSKVPKIAAIIIATVVLLGAVIGIVAGGSDEEENSYSRGTSSYASNENSNSDSNKGISTSKKVDLGLSVCWAGWNVGASSPEGYGNYYAWGETTTKSNYTEGSYQYHNGSYIDIGSNISGTCYDVARAQWGGNWRLPTNAEYQELVDRCTWTWTTYKCVPGYKVTGPNGNSIFLPATHYCYGAEIYYRGSDGYYWSGTLNVSNSFYAYSLRFNSSDRSVYGCYREFGHTVRPVSD